MDCIYLVLFSLQNTKSTLQHEQAHTHVHALLAEGIIRSYNHFHRWNRRQEQLEVQYLVSAADGWVDDLLYLLKHSCLCVKNWAEVRDGGCCSTIHLPTPLTFSYMSNTLCSFSCYNTCCQTHPLNSVSGRKHKSVSPKMLNSSFKTLFVMKLLFTQDNPFGLFWNWLITARNRSVIFCLHCVTFHTSYLVFLLLSLILGHTINIIYKHYFLQFGQKWKQRQTWISTDKYWEKSVRMLHQEKTACPFAIDQWVSII